jgi:hypothetical protein
LIQIEKIQLLDISQFLGAYEPVIIVSESERFPPITRASLELEKLFESQSTNQKAPLMTILTSP